MGYKDPYMLELGVCLGGKRFMDMMLLKRRNHRAKHVIVGQNGVVCFVEREKRPGKGSQRRKRERLRAKRLRLKYMHLKILRRALKVKSLLIVTYESYTRKIKSRCNNESVQKIHFIEMFYYIFLNYDVIDWKYFSGIDNEKSSLMPQIKFEKKFGQSPVFIASTLLEEGGVPQGSSSASLLKEAIHVISCGYEDKTEWGKEVSFKTVSSYNT